MHHRLPDNRPSLGLVIPAYNRKHLIGETIESAINQNLPFTEIIVVDDGSTDGTYEFLEKYSREIQIIRTTNKGVQAARNKGVAESKCEYICLCDSDDLLEPWFVETIVEWFACPYRKDILYSNFVTFDEHGKKSDKFSQAPQGFFAGGKSEGNFLFGIPELYQRLITFQPLFSTGCVFSKKFYEQLGGYNTRFNRVPSEDFEFALRVASLGAVSLCIRPLARIRKHSGNDSADAMKQCIGEARILAYALEAHPQAKHHKKLILESMNERRTHAFDAAFARGEFKVALELLALLPKKPQDPKFSTKAFISRLPPPLRTLAWRMTQ